ncbi:MAG: MOSC domain-containing protein [Desulfocapsaceae bacterium]|nr:MOSC domain-containing protein [Desulfocapsaceae bacterium]
MAYVEAVCTSEKKGVVKKRQEKVELKEDWGIVTDAHAGDWHRQVSLLAGESIDLVKLSMPSLKNGAFAENIITRGIDLSNIKIGERLKIGEKVVLEITQIGKECHNNGCAIKKKTGDCIMPREGLFAKVIAGGRVQAGDIVVNVS